MYLLNNFKEPQLKKSGYTLGSYGVDPLEVEVLMNAGNC